MKYINSLTTRQKQTFLGITTLLFVCFLFWNNPLFIWAPLFLGVGILVLLKGIIDPSFFCLIFFSFCLFRIQDFIPQLMPYNIPMISALLGTISLAYNMTLHRKKFYWDREMTYFVLFFLQVTAGVLLAFDFSTSFADWTNLFSKFPIIFFLIAWSLNGKKDFKWLIIIMFLCGSIIAIMTLYNKFEGIGLVEGTRASVLAGVKSYISDPNDLAFTLLIPISFSCAVFITQSIPVPIRFLGLISTGLITSAIISTQSRGGLLGLIGIFIYFFSRRIKSKSPIIFLACSLCIFLYFVGDVSQRNTLTDGSIDASSMGRLHAWKAAINMAIHHPIFGVGLGGFIPNFDKYAIGPGNTDITAHSSWFLVLAESGFIGLILFICCIYLAIKTTQQTIKRIEALDLNYYPQKPIYLIFAYGLFGSFVGYCISGSFLSQGFTWPIYILLALSISLSYNLKKIYDEDPNYLEEKQSGRH